MSEFLRHQPCPSCSSSDAFAIYDDGHGYCFSCGHLERNAETEEQAMTSSTVQSGQFIKGDYRALKKRGLDEESCKLWDYSVATFHGQPVQVAGYRDMAGQLIAQKVRFPNKDFILVGETKNLPLYGMHLWRDKGKRVVITEGEIDAISVSSVQAHKWPVVSVPNGAQGAVKAVQRSLDWLEGFEQVVLAFDNDEPGQKAAKECALLLSPGKAMIASLPLKDANEMLVAGRGPEIVNHLWNAKVFRPDGIVAGTDLWEKITEQDFVESTPYPWAAWNTILHGCRKGELVTITSGTGIGKSSVCREIAYSFLRASKAVGYIALEESVRRTALGLMSIHLGKRLHLDLGVVSEKELRDAFEQSVGNGKLFLYDHFGSTDSKNLLSRIRYMVRALGCDYIFLDHLSIVVSGLESGDERRLIDNTMTNLRCLVEELGCGMILVSHLRRPQGQGHEEGGQTSLSQLRGSAGIAQLSDIVIGLERDQQDETKKNETVCRVLKNRFSGETGVGGCLVWNRDSGRLSEGEFTPAAECEDCDVPF